jgi:predicted TIM-barrel fold metal-dependent hydrolase
MIIDAHLHLWEKQAGMVNGRPVFGVGGGKSNFGGEIRQMMPPYMDNANTIEILLNNMDYSGVAGAVVTQEYIDGNQDEYLLHAKSIAGDRLKICSIYENSLVADERFDGVKIPAQRLENPDLTLLMPLMKDIEKKGQFLSIDLADGDIQTGYMKEVIEECPNLRIAIGHFGMVTRDKWEEQINLAQNKNVYIESGGITWLYNYEFYPYPTAIRAIKEAAQICGMEKLMWGSDYPRTMSEITYKMSFDFVLKSNELTAEEKAMFLGETAEKFYGFTGIKTPDYIPNML